MDLKKPVQARLDWRAYFKAFCELHGEPLRFGKARLLFPDGWQYNSRSHAGPEYPPPTDTRSRILLQKEYWNLRLEIVGDQRDKLEAKLKGLEELRQLCSAPLQETRVYYDGESKRIESGPLDTAPLCARLVWLTGELEKCNKQLETLGREYLALAQNGPNH